ncbi:glycosyltransferase [Planococcus sp. YIM B11945]|uniref:glycosyltransferase n=1 Tax=Planococcus sp. YIM B11945 TaxID=3435410 RepID=UPI003D7CB833
MKVLQINFVCGIGSTGRIATDIHSLLVEKGYESWIAYGRGEPRNCNNVLKIGSKADTYLHVAKTRIFDKHGFGSKKATEVFIDKVKQLNPDIIHLHNIHGYYINVEVLFNYLKESNKKVFWTLHDCWVFTGHCSNFDYIGCNRWETGCYECPQKKEYPKSLVKDNSFENYIKKKELLTGIKNMTIITPSKWLSALVKKSFLKDYPVKVINNGIDLAIFKPTPTSFKKENNLEEKFVILGVANVWGERKGLHYFIELANKIEPDEVVVLVGLTEKQIKSLPKNIIGIRNTESAKQLAEIYTSADIYVNPTLEDNFPTTNLEALACGTPIITFNTGGSIESSLEPIGTIVEKGNIEELIKAIKKIRNNEELNYTDKCIDYAYRNFNKNDRFNDYIFEYNMEAE